MGVRQRWALTRAFRLARILNKYFDLEAIVVKMIGAAAEPVEEPQPVETVEEPQPVEQVEEPQPVEEPEAVEEDEDEAFI